MIRYTLVVMALAACLLLGNVVIQWTGLPVPAALIGMLLLLGALLCLPRVPEVLARISDWMLRYLVLWILPSALGVVAYGAALKQHWLPIVLAGVIGTALTAVVTAWVFVVTLRWTEKNKQAPASSALATNTDNGATTPAHQELP
ncbi:CidA/LrgA family protein [Lampropedia puyangensis]|uniref:CidA/LrgA family protein n=1 Tax=Lampropedia puyangensis TaxID=1330072 RepID=A0A4S8F979_9BURK|nr:CidA/LrgA family protein [Lampropedia puyangensis]THU02824.1 CidA/LrgA family protein [Lampropedia puyangensis]